MAFISAKGCGENFGNAPSNNVRSKIIVTLVTDLFLASGAVAFGALVLLQSSGVVSLGLSSKIWVFQPYAAVGFVAAGATLFLADLALTVHAVFTVHRAWGMAHVAHAGCPSQPELAKLRSGPTVADLEAARAAHEHCLDAAELAKLRSGPTVADLEAARAAHEHCPDAAELADLRSRPTAEDLEKARGAHEHCPSAAELAELRSRPTAADLARARVAVESAHANCPDSDELAKLRARSLPSSPAPQGDPAALRHLFSTYLDQSAWSDKINPGQYGLVFPNPLSLNFADVMSAVRRLGSLSVSGDHGWAFLEIPKGLSVDMLVTKIFGTEERPALIGYNDQIRQRIGNMTAQVPYRVIISENVIGRSGEEPVKLSLSSVSAEVERILSPSGCGLPRLLEVLTVSLLSGSYSFPSYCTDGTDAQSYLVLGAGSVELSVTVPQSGGIISRRIGAVHRFAPEQSGNSS